MNEDTFDINAGSKDSAIIERYFTGCTKRDSAIKNLPVPQKPVWLNLVIRLIRYYQKNISHKLGNRCVFDPSCSHYSELAFRQEGLVNGIKLTLKRLHRCRPQNGGIDELK